MKFCKLSFSSRLCAALATVIFSCAPLSCAGQLRDPGLRLGHDSSRPHHGRVAQQLHLEGIKTTKEACFPIEHQFHETVEITQGFNDWFETGFYIFTSYGPNQGYKWVGDHIRPRVRVPDSWHWPVGVSLSTEIGYQRPIFSADTWTWEIRPIVDKQMEVLVRGVQSRAGAVVPWPERAPGRDFSPNFKGGVFVDAKAERGHGVLRLARARHRLRSRSTSRSSRFVPAIDYDFGPNWEFNLGVGVGATRSTDHLLVKMIIGRRFRFITPHMHSKPAPEAL